MKSVGCQFISNPFAVLGKSDPPSTALPSAADLDAVATEEAAKAATASTTPIVLPVGVPTLPTEQHHALFSRALGFLKTAGKDTGKGVEEAGKFTVEKVLPTVVPLAIDAAETFVPALRFADPLMREIGVLMTPKGENPMLEDMAISLIMSALNDVVKNPAKKAAFQSQMVRVGTDILMSYGYTVTAPPTAA